MIIPNIWKKCSKPSSGYKMVEISSFAFLFESVRYVHVVWIVFVSALSWDGRSSILWKPLAVATYPWVFIGVAKLPTLLLDKINDKIQNDPRFGFTFPSQKTYACLMLLINTPFLIPGAAVFSVSTQWLMLYTTCLIVYSQHKMVYPPIILLANIPHNKWVCLKIEEQTYTCIIISLLLLDCHFRDHIWPFSTKIHCLPSGKLTVCYWKWPIYSWFSYETLWFSRVFCLPEATSH